MRRPIMLALIFAFAAVAIGTFARAPSAQTGAVLEACEGAETAIRAADLPNTLEPGECPTEGRAIVDGRVGSVVPAAGESVHAEVLTPSGAQELELMHLPDGTIKLEHVGDDSGVPREETAPVFKAGGPGECSDYAYTDGQRRVVSPLEYRFNRSTAPSELSERETVEALRRGAGNVYNTKNSCRMGDRVPVGLDYSGNTGLTANITPGALCGGDDGRSVVSFGTLPSGTLAATCNWGRVQPGYDKLTASDVKFRGAVGWTTNPSALSCSGAYDLEGVMTHERGHTFGLGHVSETYHGNLTMSTDINGTCQSSERTLGRGDVLGLDNKYP